MENLNVTVDLPVICTRGMLVFPGIVFGCRTHIFLKCNGFSCKSA